MPGPGLVLDERAAIQRATELADRGERAILGIAGAPGSGKSTLAARVCEAVGPRAVVVPMDGFHLADVVLEALGLRARKGAPETFDAFGYAALLGRLRHNADPVVYAPAFERSLEQPLGAAIAVAAEARLIITEGNYLLLDEPGWCDVRPLLDESWYCEVDDGLRRSRLVDRHVRFGKSAAAAAAWVESVDDPNAEFIALTRGSADHVVSLT